MLFLRHEPHEKGKNVSLRFNPGPDLERSFRYLCTSNRRTLNEQFRIILEAYLSGTNVPVSQLERPESSGRVRTQETVTGSERPKASLKLPKRKLSAADLVDLSDKEKWAVISSSDAKLSDDAIELLADFSASNSEPDDDDDFDEDPE